MTLDELIEKLQALKAENPASGFRNVVITDVQNDYTFDEFNIFIERDDVVIEGH